jgi:hypothetical protein
MKGKERSATRRKWGDRLCDLQPRNPWRGGNACKQSFEFLKGTSASGVGPASAFDAAIQTVRDYP